MFNTYSVTARGIKTPHPNTRCAHRIVIVHVSRCREKLFQLCWPSHLVSRHAKRNTDVSILVLFQQCFVHPIQCSGLFLSVHGCFHLLMYEVSKLDRNLLCRILLSILAPHPPDSPFLCINKLNMNLQYSSSPFQPILWIQNYLTQTI
jgi:hypothetical protein